MGAHEQDLCTSINIKPAHLLNSSSNRDSSAMAVSSRKRWDQSFGSKCRGLIELFVSKDVSDDQQLIDYVTAQCNISQEQDTLLGVGCNTSFPQPPVVSPVDHDSNVAYNISVDRILLCSTSPMNVLQRLTYNSENGMKNVLVLVRIDNALVFDRDKGWDSLLSTNRWQDPRGR
ncbi:unnamed protein product [Prunus armeniaca]